MNTMRYSIKCSNSPGEAVPTVTRCEHLTLSSSMRYQHRHAGKEGEAVQSDSTFRFRSTHTAAHPRMVMVNQQLVSRPVDIHSVIKSLLASLT